jgi:hypothetical protein
MAAKLVAVLKQDGKVFSRSDYPRDGFGSQQFERNKVRSPNALVAQNSSSLNES